MWLFDKILDTGGSLIGYAEKYLKFKYPVRFYQEEVSSDLWRGSRVDAGQIRDLAKYKGIRTLVSLCAESCDNKEVAMECCIQCVHIPVMDNQAPTDAQMDQFLDLFKDKDNCPVYVHCEAGMGRTGVFVACYQIAIKHMSIEDAIKDGQRHNLTMPCQKKFIREYHYHG